MMTCKVFQDFCIVKEGIATREYEKYKMCYISDCVCVAKCHHISSLAFQHSQKSRIYNTQRFDRSSHNTDGFGDILVSG
jgi:hypothetical protein